MRLIDVDEEAKWASEHILDAKERHSILNFLRNCSTVDAIQVVRCNDCIRRYDTDECPMCFLSEGKYYEYTNGNGFCDRGERKEGADNG